MAEGSACAVRIGKRLRAARERRGLSAQDVADRLDCGKSTVYAWERGASMPNAEDLRKLSRAFRCSADWLIAADTDTAYLALVDRRVERLLHEATDPEQFDALLATMSIRLHDDVEVETDGRAHFKSIESVLARGEKIRGREKERDGA